MIPESEFARLVTRIQPVVDELAKREGIGQPTEFEVKTILGFLYFAEQKCDCAVVEVGLGGRYDATNVLYPEVSVITNVTLDHMERLGNTVAQIAAEKAGIVKEEIPCVTGATGDAVKVIAQQCHDLDSSIWRLGEEILLDGTADNFSVRVGHHRYEDLTIRMKGEHQLRNAALAVAAVDQMIREHIPISDTAIRDGLARACLPGRFEVVQENPTLILDGAHNPAKAEALANTLKQVYPNREIFLVLGAVRGHDMESSFANIAPLASRIIATQPQERAIPAEEVAEVARKHCSQVEVVPTVADAVQTALSQAKPEDVVCVTGSFYVVGEVPR
jgi:dihydrofolate synthase/folylpolyglutamate synthase